MEPKLDAKADYGFAARDVLKKGLPVTNNYEQSIGTKISDKAEYGFGVNKLANSGIPVADNYEQYIGKTVPAPAVISARPAVEQLKTDKEKLGNIEAGLTSPSTSTANVAAIPNVFNNNPALSSSINTLNQTIAGAGGQLNPEQKALYDQIIESVNKISSSTADARIAESKNDYAGVSTATQTAETARDEYKALLDSFMTSSKDLRAKYLETLSPTSDETNLKNQIADLEAAAKLGAEAQYGLGRPLSISTGRAEKVLNQGQIQLQTLTKKLGIMLDEREAKSKGYSTAMEMLQNDFDTQFKVEEALYKRQNDTLERAAKLSETQRSAMGTLADKFKDIDVDTLSPEGKLAIQKFATSQGVDFDLAMEIIKGAHDQQMWDNNVKGRQAGMDVGSSSVPIVNTILGSGKFTKDQARQITKSIEGGEDPLTVVKNQAKGLMQGTTAALLEKNEAARDAMYQLDKSFKEFYAAGGDSGIIKGTMENVVNRLGEVKDAKLAGLAVEVGAALQKYRNAISGTAYSEQEGREIKKVFPGIEKGEVLNSAIVKSRLKVFDSDIDSAYRAVLGGEYDKMKQGSSDEQQSTGGEPDLSDLDFKF